MNQANQFEPNYVLRHAQERDAQAIAELFLIASDGLAAYIWSRLAKPQQALGEVGAADEVESDPVLKPYAELEDPGSLYLSGLAVRPPFRGTGIGTRLLHRVHVQAAELGCPRVSLICFEQNAGAMQLYRREGYVELGRRGIVPHPSLHYEDGDAILLARDIDRPGA